MSEIQEETKTHLHTLSFLGPASVIFSVLLLVINDSPFYIDISVTALLGLVLSWRYKLKGFAVSSLLLGSLVLYEHFFQPEPVALWDIGLAFSVVLAFLLTSLASLEFWETVRSFGAATAEEIRAWEEKVDDALSGKKLLERAVRDLEERLKSHAAEAELQTTLREKGEGELEILKQALALKTDALEEALLSKSNALSQQEEKIKQLTGELVKLTDRLKGLESEKEGIGKALEEALLSKSKATFEHEKLKQELILKSNALEEAHLSKSNATFEHEKLKQELILKTNALEEAQASKLNALSDQEEKIKQLTGELEKLTDRLKGLESEKEEIAKALGEALAPKPEIPEAEAQRGNFAQMQGLYLQLRSQFEEKSCILDQTRAELFQAHEALAALELSSKETNFDHHDEWSEHVNKLSEQISTLELEVALLEELVFKGHHPL